MWPMLSHHKSFKAVVVCLLAFLLLCFASTGVFTMASMASEQMPSAYVEITNSSSSTPGSSSSAAQPPDAPLPGSNSGGIGVAAAASSDAETISTNEDNVPVIEGAANLPKTGRNLIQNGLFVFTAICLIGTGIVVLSNQGDRPREKGRKS